MRASQKYKTKYRTLGLAGLLAVVAMMAVAAVGAASASAAQSGVCYRVEEPGTGNYKGLDDKTGECVEKVTSGGEYIKVIPGTSKLVAGSVDCFKVSEPGTGNYKDAGCTTAEAKGEYIKVKARPEYKLCVKVETGEPSNWNENCNAKVAGGGWAKVTPRAIFVAGTKWCAPVEDGEKSTYKNSACTEAGAEDGYIKFDMPVGVNPNTFTSTTTGVKRLWSTQSGFKAEIECTKTEDHGELTGPRSDSDTILFTGCKEIEPFAGTCKGLKPLKNAGEIETNVLTSKPVWINEAETLVGIALAPESGTEFTEFECPGLLGNVKIKVTGSLVGELASKVNEMRLTDELKFECVPAGSTKQKYKAYWENKVKEVDFLSSNGNEACEEETVPDTLTFKVPVEVKT